MKFYIVGTPIGNLEDITLRAIRILKEAQFVVAEDTRVTKKLLSHYEIKTPVISFHAHSGRSRVRDVINLLAQDKTVALVTDAGTPGISDPGAFLIRTVRAELPECEIIPIPGPSAVATALSASGADADQFVFFGFPPHKKGRETFFKTIAKEERTCVIYESPHRFMKMIDSLIDLIPERTIVIARELTKIHEQFVRGTPEEVRTFFQTHKDNLRGEFVVIVEGI